MRLRDFTGSLQALVLLFGKMPLCLLFVAFGPLIDRLKGRDRPA